MVCQDSTKVRKSPQMVAKVRKWSQTSTNGYKSSQMITKVRKWTQKFAKGHKSSKIVTKVRKWSQKSANGHKSPQMIQICTLNALSYAFPSPKTFSLELQLPIAIHYQFINSYGKLHGNKIINVSLRTHMSHTHCIGKESHLFLHHIIIIIVMFIFFIVFISLL